MVSVSLLDFCAAPAALAGWPLAEVAAGAAPTAGAVVGLAAGGWVAGAPPPAAGAPLHAAMNAASTVRLANRPNDVPLANMSLPPHSRRNHPNPSRHGAHRHVHLTPGNPQ